MEMERERERENISKKIVDLDKMIELTRLFLYNLENERKSCITEKHKLCGGVHEWVRDVDNGSNCGENRTSYICKKCNIDSWSVQHVI